MKVAGQKTPKIRYGPFFLWEIKVKVLDFLCKHFDKILRVWGLDSKKFRPERFLSPDETKVIKHEALVPFSVGKRVCPGKF